MFASKNTQPIERIAEEAAPLLHRASEQAGALAQRSVDALRDGSEHVRQTALRASDGTVSYIRHEPVKSMLIAAATGAALMALITLTGRSPNRR